MKNFSAKCFAALFVMLTAVFVAQAQTLSEVERRLAQIAEADQQVRLQLIKAQQSGNIDSLLLGAERMSNVDLENQTYVARLFAGGLPDGLSNDAYEAIYLVVDHADYSFQKRYFKYLRRAANEGRLQLSSINTLHDRMRMRRHRRQIYGTQTWSHTTIIEGQALPQQVNYVWPVRCARGVDKRRAESGMGTMKDQTAAHEKLGYRLVWDRSLSVREFRRMMEAE